jgi:transcriptional regulator with XRE-family HTH domain
MVTKQDVALAIKKLRGHRTQKAVAEAAGVDRPTWNQYEKARAMPKHANFDKIADGLGCTPEELDRAIIEEWRRRLQRTSPGSVPTSSPLGAATAVAPVPPLGDLPEGAGHHVAAVTAHLLALASLLAQAHVPD